MERLVSIGKLYLVHQDPNIISHFNLENSFLRDHPYFPKIYINTIIM